MKFIILLLLTLCASMIINFSKMNDVPVVHLLNVGQGDAILLRSSKGHTILIDGGPGRSVLTELGRVLPQLEREIDLLIITHPHLDHIEGLYEVMKRFKIKAVLASLPAYESDIYTALLSELYQIPLYIADDDTDFQVGDLYLDVLYPFEPVSGESMENINNASPVIKVNDLILLTGDAEHEVEAALIASGVDLKAQILKMGHHGSRTSSTEAFLDAVQPEIALISTGAGNSFGHPHEETLRKFSERAISIFRTDIDPKIRFELSID